MTEEFQVAKQGSKNHKRVYIGNLPNQYDSQESLQEALGQWIKDQIPDISVESLQVNTSGRGKFPHALLDCGYQANQVIRSLHQQTWQGQRLTVQREKRNNNNSNKNINPSQTVKKPGFGGKSFCAPIARAPAPAAAAKFTPIPLDQAAQDIQSVVEEEFKQLDEVSDDPINVALASTAAASLLAAMGAFGAAEEDTNDDQFKEHSQEITSTNWEHKIAENDDFDDEISDDEQVDEPATFQMKPMSDLLAEFGQADPNWQSKQVDTTAEVTTDENAPSSQLAPKGKAPIHICLTSFGFSKGAPKRMDGWSYRQPLLPMDCREYPTVPHYLAWQDGLSGAVKRALQYTRDQEGTPYKLLLKDFACKTVAEEVLKVLLEAQNEGGHGYASPLEMTIYVGSDIGRHRSVVACELAATQLRKFLRANADNAIHQPVSVGTLHREVQNHRQQRYNLRTKKNKHGKVGEGKEGKTLIKKKMEFAGDW
jgi:hypothetical protein